MTYDASATAAEAMKTGLRPSASAKPPVGSSNSSTTNPWVAATAPYSATVRPRSSGSSAVTGMMNPVGSQRSPASNQKRVRRVMLVVQAG